MCARVGLSTRVKLPCRCSEIFCIVLTPSARLPVGHTRMSFILNAVLTDPSQGLTLDTLERILRSRIASDPSRSDIIHEPGVEPICSRHLRFLYRETDWGTPGNWFALIFLESGDEIREQNRDHVAQSLNRCPSPDAVRDSDSRVRVLFHDDPKREYTNTMIELMSFLDGLSGSIVYDPQQSKFTN